MYGTGIYYKKLKFCDILNDSGISPACCRLPDSIKFRPAQKSRGRGLAPGRGIVNLIVISDL